MIDNSKEYIACAAIWYRNGKKYPFQEIYGIDSGFIIGSFRHPMAISVCPENPYVQDCRINDGTATLPFEWGKDFADKKSSMTVQGFITSWGRFVDRKQAFTIAMESGQITRESIVKTQGTDPEKHDGMNLYSEDIFPVQWTTDSDGKRHVFDLFSRIGY